MKVLIAALVAAVVAQDDITVHGEGHDDARIVYRPFHNNMLKAHASGAGMPDTGPDLNANPSTTWDDHMGRWWKEPTSNLDADGKLAGPQDADWTLDDAAKAYWSYDADDTNGFKHFNYKVINDHKNADDPAWYTNQHNTTTDADAAAKMYTQNEWFGRMRTEIRDMNTVETAAEAKLAASAEPSTGWEYLKNKPHLTFFPEDTHLCAPQDSEEGENENIIAGLRRKHNSGSKYQGCSLSDCALTVMYKCSWMCLHCEKEWCTRQCETFKRNSGSCSKIFDDADPDNCGHAKVEAETQG